MRLLGLAMLAALMLSCVDKGPPKKKIDPAFIQANLLAEAPETMDNRVEADLGGKILYLGNDVDTVNLTPGGKARVLHYWKVVEAPGADWRVFAHVHGAGKSDWMNVDYTDMRAGYPPAKWKAGDIIRDEQKFALAEGWKSSYAQLSVGLYRQGSQGLEGRMKIASGPADAEHRVQAVRFSVDPAGKAGKGSAGRYVIRRAASPIEIDGRADEEAWKQAPRSPAFKLADGGAKMTGSAHARLLWDDDHLYAFVEVEDDDIYSPYTERDDPLWKADCVELFIDADGSGGGYVELQVNPRNAVFDAWFPRTRAQKHHFEWNSGMKTAVAVRGDAGKRGSGDTGWDVEIAIPLEDVKGMDEGMDVRIPPRPGDEWRLNIVRVDVPKEKETVTASSWNPITIQDFHALSRMLTVVFGDEGGETEADESGETEADESGETEADESGETEADRSGKAVSPDTAKDGDSR